LLGQVTFALDSEDEVEMGVAVAGCAVLAAASASTIRSFSICLSNKAVSG